jgi:hypothetical protein
LALALVALVVKIMTRPAMAEELDLTRERAISV